MNTEKMIIRTDKDETNKYQDSGDNDNGVGERNKAYIWQGKLSNLFT